MATEMNGSYCVPVLDPAPAMRLCSPLTKFSPLSFVLVAVAVVVVEGFCFLIFIFFGLIKGLIQSGIFRLPLSNNRNHHQQQNRTPQSKAKKPHKNKKNFKPLNSKDLVLRAFSLSPSLRATNKIGLWVWLPWCTAPWSYICSSLSSLSLLTGSCHIRRWIGGSALPPSVFPLSFSV